MPLVGYDGQSVEAGASAETTGGTVKMISRYMRLFRFTRAFSLALYVTALLIEPQLAVGRTDGLESHKPLVIAHRGGALESTENTIGAFQRAVKIGAAGIETDIRLTRDGVVVVYHDDYFGRVEGLTEAQRKRLVSDLNFSELTAQTLIPIGGENGML